LSQIIQGQTIKKGGVSICERWQLKVTRSLEKMLQLT
jgi:hypothetical protein